MIQVRGQTFAQKFLAARAGRNVVPGDVVELSPDLVSSHDDTETVMEHFAAAGADRVCDPELHAIVLGCGSAQKSADLAGSQRRIRAFAEGQGIERFFDVDTGLCHQVLIEQGFARPGRLIVGSDPHTVSLGALGAFATRITAQEIAETMVTARVRLTVPETLRITMQGALTTGVAPQDLALKIAGELAGAGAAQRAAEIGGTTISSMSVGGRMALCGIISGTGLNSTFIAPDANTFGYLNGRARDNFEIVCGDPDALLHADFNYDASALGSQIARRDARAGAAPCADLAGTRIDQVVIGGGTGGRQEDLHCAAAILAGRKLHPRTRCLILPASSEVLRRVVADGTLLVLLEAGAVLASPTCAPCRSNPAAWLAPGEIGLSSAADSGQGVCGAGRDRLHFGSPASCAAAAVAGEIIDPRELISDATSLFAAGAAK